MTRFTSLLIANRGEIAVRILHTARRMGLRVIAVYSDADADALHVRLADQAVRLGAAPAQASYLNIAAIIEAARASGAQAVHPGYGFLAENADFAQAVTDAGLAWVGPPAAAIRAMGDKARAKRLMLAAGVPCVPGYDGADQDAATLRAQADAVGYPLMIKATAGGGGRGMRRVDAASAFDAALASARSEAAAAFGSDHVLLERAIADPRHVEIQVFADAHGHVVHLGERDCSVQRRHQKLIEEAPSPALHGASGARLRRQMGAMAVAATRAIDYRGAGTIECLLDGQGRFYFMEMNTRLQVEHPVTEALTGYDLVEWQLRVARGKPLPHTDQDAIVQRFESGGHAIEVRLCAEDPTHDFLPQSGPVLAWRPGGGVRVDHALQAGQAIPPHYDSMVAKFIAHGADREAACQALQRALADAVLLGVPTNQAYLAACLRHPVFRAGQATTGFVQAHTQALRDDMPALRPAVAALALYAARALRDGHDPMQVRLALDWPVPMRLGIDGAPLHLRVLALGGNRYRIEDTHGGTDLAILACDGAGLRLSSEHGVDRLAWAWDDTALRVSQDGRQCRLTDHSLQAAHRADAAHDGAIRAPMAGRIVALHVAAGDTVHQGQALLVLEAMKMEHPSLAPMDATVTGVHVQAGAQVQAGTLMVELSPPAAAAAQAPAS
ncbi:MAG: biotin/lipoyl-binding protein [Rhodoferax sp.]|nr:biotin/lipoyl-binding protein [Rhodoferax sp.]